MEASDSVKPEKRVLSRLTGRYYGATRQPEGGGLPYLRVGRLRDRSDWPDTVEFADAADGLQALELDGEQQLFESAYIVPFGASQRVAVMGPLQGLVSGAGLGDWISFMAGHDGTELRIELAPELDQKVLEKLSNQAVALSRLTVRFPAGADLDTGQLVDGGSAANAISDAVEARPTEASIEVTMSTGHRNPAGAGIDLLEAAKKLIGVGADKLEVTMKLESAGGFTTETHNILRDDIAVNIAFAVDEDEAQTELSVLAAINVAIETFQKQIS